MSLLYHKSKGFVVFCLGLCGIALILFGEVSAQEALPLVIDMCRFILGFSGDIPGARPEECGNYQEQNLDMAKFYIARYLRELTEHARTEYPG